MSIVPFLIAKAHANHSQSLNGNQMNSMITAEKLTDVENIIQGTRYGHLLNEVRPSVDLPQFEIHLRRDYARLLNIYRNAATGRVKDLLNAFTISVEAENMDMIFQAIIRDNVDENLNRIIIPVGKFGTHHYKRIMENTDPMIATDFILYPELRKAAQVALNQSNDPDEQVFLLSSALSHTAYSILGKVAPKWITDEINLLNLETICRAINLDINVDEWLIPNIGNIYRQRRYLMNLANPRDVLNYLAPKFNPSQPLQLALNADDVVVKLEDEVLNYLYFQRYRNFMLFGTREEAILDFFSIKRAEIDDISRVMTSKILRKTTVSELREMVYPIYH